jgi:predicted peptidase
MKQGRGIKCALFLSFALLAAIGGGCGGGGGGHSSSDTTPTIEATIKAVTTIAFLDVDGPKVQAVAVEYSDNLPAGSVDLSTYEVFNYANLPQVTNAGAENETSTTPAYVEGIGTGTPGAPTKIYVSQTPAIDPNGQGDSSGKYVIIEINTDSQLNGVSSNWRPKLAGGVKQVKAISAGNVSASPSDVVGNYVPVTVAGRNGSTTIQTVTDDSSYILKGLEGYQIFTDNPDVTVASMVKGPAFATSGRSEATGQRHDVKLMYSLFVPEDYDAQVAAGKKFALALHIEDAGVLGADPMIALTETNVAANYAQLGQKIVKEDGLGGLIVVLPQIVTPTVADNWTATQDLEATWNLLDHLTQKYAIDTNRIYGSGQSMGGMQVLYMASHRDNYFAGIWSIGSQWANNYDKADVLFQSRGGSALYSPFVYGRDTFITNPDWENWYWSLSDDNILITNMSGDGFATTLWQILRDYYDNKAGVVIPKLLWNPITTSRAQQNEHLRLLISQPNATGIYWNALSDGNHMATWIYAHAITASYDWLLKQTRQSAEARAKLDVLAQKYIDETTGGTYCLSTGTASGGPSMTGKAGLDYQPRPAVTAKCL